MLNEIEVEYLRNDAKRHNACAVYCAGMAGQRRLEGHEAWAKSWEQVMADHKLSEAECLRLIQESEGSLINLF